MKNKFEFYRRAVSLLCSLNLLCQPVSSLFVGGRFVFAQEITPTEVAAETVTPTVELRPSETPQPEITPAPENLPTVSPTSLPTPTAESTVVPTNIPTIVEPSIEPSISPELSIAPTLSLTPTDLTTTITQTLPIQLTETLTSTPSEEIIETIVPTPTIEASIITGTVAPTEVPVPDPTEAPLEKICLGSGEIKDSVNESWDVNPEEKWAETKEKVQLGIRYVFPLENKVTITFKCLSKDEGLRTSLKVRQVKVSDLNLPEGTNPYGEYAYDITTGMKDGDFEFDITLPKPEDRESEVKYLEDQNSEVKTVEENKTKQEGEVVKVEGLDHLSIWITSVKATDSDSQISALFNNQEKILINQPGASVEVALKVGVLWDVWKGTAWKVGSGSWQCVDTPDHPAISSEFTEKFNITAQNSYTTEDVKFRIYKSNDCSGTYSERTASGAITVVETKTNPSLSQTCGLDIALVIDNSNSVGSSQLLDTKNAFKGLVDALSGTPTQFSVTKFGSSASVIRTFTSDGALVKNAINSIFTGGGATNWKDGLIKAKSTFDPRGDSPNLMIFASDGNPTYPSCGGASTCIADVKSAVVEANTAKDASIRILALGINDGLSVDNLKFISGPNVNTGNAVTSDVITTDFAGLATQLASFASQTCGGTITVSKFIDNTSTSGGADWMFNVSGPNTYSNNLGTDTNGQDNTGTIPAGSGYSIVETGLLPGYSFGSAVCRNQAGAPEGSPIADGIGSIDISGSDIISCDFINTTNPQTGSISGMKWEDMNGNGVKDTGDLPISGWAIRLDIGADGTIDQTTTTDVNGVYTFDNLLPGTYKVLENTPSPWNVSHPSPGINYYNGIVLAAGENLADYDFGNYENGKIEGYKWEDTDGDGIKDSDETAPANQWEIKLWKEIGGVKVDQGSVYTQLPDGNYSLGVGPGTYYLSEVLQPGWAQTYPNAEFVGPVVVTSGSISENNNFGNIKYGSIDGHKYIDQNGNRNQETGEPMVTYNDIPGGVKIFIDENANGVFDTGEQTVNTDNAGYFKFNQLVAGTYDVCEEVPAGWVNTSWSNIPEHTNCQRITMAAGETVAHDFGNVRYSKLGDLVWKDINDNNVQDASEPGISGVTVEVYEDDGDGIFGESLDDLKFTTATDANGGYLFDKLIAGTYFVFVDQTTLPGSGYDISEGSSNPIKVVLGNSETNLNVDFGFAPPVSILLTKSNDKPSAAVGDIVTYTLNIKTGERVLSSMTLLDNLPEGFIYQTGTATVDGGTVVSVEPTLTNNNKTLIWSWSSVPSFGTVTVIYKTKIDSANQAASYTNFAWVTGKGSPRTVESEIVDSTVTIGPVVAVSAQAGENKVLGASTEGQVLGAVLPAAGAETWYLILALGMIGSGLMIEYYLCHSDPATDGRRIPSGSFALSKVKRAQDDKSKKKGRAKK